MGGRDWPGRKARPTEKEEIKVFANVVAASVYIMKIVFPLVSVSILQLKLEVGPVFGEKHVQLFPKTCACLLYTSPSPRDSGISRMPSSA